MGWVLVKDLKTGETKFYGDSPVELKPELPVDNPLASVRAGANIARFKRAIGEHDD